MAEKNKHQSIGTIVAGIIAIALIVLTAPEAKAAAQDALGAGDALDASLSTRSRRNAPSQRMDFRSRNLLITSDVAGGRGFRGSVGYEAAGDFNGALGSNDLFSFRAGSAYSAPGLIRYGSAYTQMRLGAVGGAIEYRRDGFAPGALDLHRASITRIDVRTATADAQSVFDRISADRLVSNQLMSATPQTIGVVYDERGDARFVESSPLRGLFTRPIDEAATGEGGSLLDRAAAAAGRSPDDRAARQEQVIAPFASMRIGDDAGAAARTERVDGTIDSSRVNSAAGESRDAYARILQRVVDRYAAAQDVDMRFDPTMLSRLGVEYDELRTQLATADPSAQRTRPEDRLPGDEIEPGMQDDPARAAPEDPTDVTTLIRPEAGRTMEHFNVVLKHGEIVQTLVGETDDRFNEIMAEAEQRLRIGEFFLAERSFERALRMVRGHPLASAGYGHSQLGAGLYRTSYHTLRTLLTEHPAMIDVRYQTGLIPNRVRLLNTVGTLEQRLRDEDFDRDLNGFLLAYIGHQLQRDDLIVKGIDAMLEADADDLLAPLLRAVWQGDESDDASDDDADANDESADDVVVDDAAANDAAGVDDADDDAAAGDDGGPSRT